MNRLNTMTYECLCDFTVGEDMNIVFNGRALALALMYLRIQTAIRTPNKRFPWTFTTVTQSSVYTGSQKISGDEDDLRNIARKRKGEQND